MNPTHYNHIVSLVQKYLKNKLEVNERMELENWLDASDLNRRIFKELTDREGLEKEVDDYDKEDADLPAMKKEMLGKIGQGKLLRMHRLRAIAAAAALLLLGFAGWYWLSKGRLTKDKDNGQALVSHDVDPGSNKALLILGDNSKLVLDSAALGKLADQGATQVMKTDSGSLSYKVLALKGAPGTKTLYNTIITPRGGTYQVTLPDGSKVWLNSESSIRFPIAFTGQERHVEISGEVYFEVARNAAQPFTVQLQGHMGEPGTPAMIRVLGTDFNVMDYQDEARTKTTLISGKIKIETNSKTKILAPGEQAVYSANSELQVLKGVDTASVVGWKNGMFYFDHEDLKSVMRVLARWYDIEVQYKGNIRENLYFDGEIQKNISLSYVLDQVLRSNFKYSIDDKTVTITGL